MGWGTVFNPDVYLSHMTFRSIGELDDKIEETQKSIDSYCTILKMMAVSTPKDIVPINDEESTLISVINYEVEDVLENLKDDMNLLTRLLLFKEHLEDTEDDIMKYNPFKEEYEKRS